MRNDCSIFTQTGNYIIVKYVNETTYGANEFTNIESRKQIQYIKYKNNIVDTKTEFTIEANTTIEIYFSEHITSLDSFFSSSNDSKAINIAYIDLSHFDSSSVNNIKYIFSGCTSLEYLDISNFNTLQVTEYVNMFEDVNSLKYINLYNAQIKDEIKGVIKEIIKDSTIMCQKDDFKIGEDITYIKACCEYNDNILKCSSENYIKMVFKLTIILNIEKI